MTIAPTSELGVVIIGRNEGERLHRCIASVQPEAAWVVYVDSNSSDGSAAWARERGVEVVELDMSRPFTAARARNEGYRRLSTLAPDLRFVQFVDGDCEVEPRWLSAAQAFANAHPEVGVVCGRRRERFPLRSVYNRLCDSEWDTPVGPALACGGDALMRVSAVEEVGGFREDLIAGEEPELCVRLRAAGWKIWRVPDPMTLHDAAITRFGQWWTRSRRAGHAYAEGAWLHGSPPERHFVVETRRAVLWGGVLPLASLSLALLFWQPAWLALLLLYPLQVLRLALRDGIADAHRRERAVFLVLARFPEVQGVLSFWLNRLRRRSAGLIEYK
jgi:GT2 family glycosyltransferase